MLLDTLANYLPVAIGFLVIAVLLAIAAAAFKKETLNEALYERQGPLLSAAEQRFYTQLLQATPSDLTLFAKVRMADVLKVQKTSNKSHWQTAFNKISGKHFDFVLCNASTFEIQAVVELDDKSHQSAKAKIKDSFINDACASAHIPIIRVKASNAYDVAMLQERIKAARHSTPEI